MELVRGLSGAGRCGEGCVLTIGTYDGIHFGHHALLARVRPRGVGFGHDFGFGRLGGATAAALSAAGTRLGFEVDVLAPVTLDGERISSSGVRAALACGDFERARRWLGRPWSMRARV